MNKCKFYKFRTNFFNIKCTPPNSYSTRHNLCKQSALLNLIFRTYLSNYSSDLNAWIFHDIQAFFIYY